MYQQRIDTDSASIEGMEGVFEEKTPDALSDHIAESPETTPSSLSKAGNRVLRGTYNQGLLLLREEQLKPLAINSEVASQQNRHPTRILYSRNPAEEPLRSFQTEIGNDAQSSYSAGAVETNLEILELVRQQAEQAKVANELIKRLTEQLKEQSYQIHRLRSGQHPVNIWQRFWQWIRSRRSMGID